ncbi:hypothetical protein GQ600_621 [Phytophthora cactorum]|nr:hypothetical protein GQ600_621 [Phytophthora cactorum]
MILKHKLYFNPLLHIIQYCRAPLYQQLSVGCDPLSLRKHLCSSTLSSLRNLHLFLALLLLRLRRHEIHEQGLYYLLFTELSPNQARCNTCLKVYKPGNGYTNQLHHFLKRHPDYQELAAATFRNGNRFGWRCQISEHAMCSAGWNGA